MNPSIAATITELEQRREKITHAITALRAVAALSDDSPPTTSFTAGTGGVVLKPGPKPGAGRGRPARHITDAQWAIARPMWDADDSAEKIGKTIGCSGARVNQYAKEKKWRVRDYSAIARKARLRTLDVTSGKPFVRGAKPQVSGTRCPKCNMISPTDPCYNCGKRKGKKP